VRKKTPQPVAGMAGTQETQAGRWYSRNQAAVVQGGSRQARQERVECGTGRPRWWQAPRLPAGTAVQVAVQVKAGRPNGGMAVNPGSSGIQRKVVVVWSK